MPTDSLGVWTAGHSKYKTRIIMAKESTIQHYTSSITGNTPSAVDLASGELAINIADEKVFLKNLLGNVVSLSQSKDLSGAFASKATVVTSFNGATGAVTGASLGANTFTALNTFNAGISSSGITGTLPSIMSSNSSGQLIITAKSSIAATPDNAVITLVGGDSDLVDPLLPSITLKASQINLGSASVNSSKLAFSVNGVTGPILITASTGIAIGSAGKNLTVTNSGVQSFNGTTGAVGYSPAFASSSVTGVASFNSTYFSVGATGVVTLASAYQVTGQTVVSGGGSQILNTSGNTVTIDNRVASSSVTGVASFNSTYLTVSNGAVSLASAYQVTGDTVAGGTGISVSRSGNTSTITNTGVQSFNGATGAVTGATLGANTFTALNTFSAGISASGGTFASDITVNSMTVGVGGGGDSSNVAVGESALYSNTNGNRNVAVGESALYSNTNGSYNVGVGRGALGSNTEGSSNVGVGLSALASNTTGEGNVGVGTSALGGNITGSNKTAIGYVAGYYRGSGVSTLTTGTGGIYIGYQARGSADTQTNEIVIGVDALGLGSNTAVIGATLQTAATIYGVLNLPSGLSAAGATFMGNISAPNIVSSFNGLTGTVTGVSSFNGLTGAVSGVTTSVANTFTALNTFSAGISASGATFAGTVNHQDNTLSSVEFLDYFERFVDLGDFTSKGSQIPIDLSTAQVFRTKLNVVCTGLSVTNTPDNGNANAVGFSLLFVGDGTARTMTWNIGSTAASWAGGTAPTYTSTLNKIDVYSFLSRDGGSTWLGFVGGQNF